MTLFTNRNIGIIALVVILGLILIAIFTCKSKENFKKKNNDNVKTIIDSEFKKIMGKTKFDKKQEIILKKFIDNIVSRVLSPKTSKMKPSNRAREILKENRKLLSKNKNIKILVKGNDRYIFDKKSNKLLKRDIVENYNIFNWGSGATEFGLWIGKALIDSEEVGSQNVKLRKTKGIKEPTIRCVGEGPSVECPRADGPNRLDYEDEHLDKQYQKDLQAWRDGPQTGYCCYSATNPKQGTCSKEPCKTGSEELVNFLPALLVGLGVALISAGAFVTIGWLLIAIGVLVLIYLVIMGALSASPEGINKEAIKEGIAAGKDLVENGLPASEIDETQYALETSRSFNSGKTDNLVIDVGIADVDEWSTGTSSNGDGYISVPGIFGSVIDVVGSSSKLDSYMSGFIDTFLSAPSCEEIDCNRNYTGIEDWLSALKKIQCCNPTRNFLPNLSPNLPDDDTNICRQQCYNGYPGIVCTDRETGEVVSETYQSSQDVSKCCRNECIDDTWHTVCPPHEGIDSGISCEDRPPKL